jgi:hypothetical protein
VAGGFEGVYERPDVWRDAAVGRAVIVDYLWRELMTIQYVVLLCFFCFWSGDVTKENGSKHVDPLTYQDMHS